MDAHIRIAGIIHLVLGLISVLSGVLSLGVFLLVVGLGEAASISDRPGLAAAVIGVVGGIGLLLLVALTCLGVPELVAGYGLLKRRPWAPAVALLASFFQLFAFPIGTAIAAYTGWVLLSEEGQDAYRLGDCGRLPGGR